MTRLKVGVKRVGSIVFGRILEQDEGLRGSVLLKALHTESEPRRPESSLYSLLDCDRLRAHDDWFAHTYEDEKTAAQVVEDITMLVAKVNPISARSSETFYGLTIVK